MNVHDAGEMEAAIKALSKKCKAIRRAHREIGVPAWRVRPPGYAELARVIAYQQLSTKAAGTIWGRVEVLLGKVTPKTVLAADEAELRACGMSRPKISHIRSIATAVEDGSLNFRRLARKSDDDAREELVAVKGIGPWTADVYLMFALGRHDVFPHADIGLSEAYKLLMKDEERATVKEFLEIGERWRPYRGVAAIMLWTWINAERGKKTGGV
jgi:DNA-3-methyladenine glycosylase II